ncbi:MAG: glutamine--fructose-6-phosphate transaminase (isomerizing) [Candidatus Omnitrophica bacterium]|nr:glutamine--fructose-6-phosphate transaminase (isomerizing) [Candidatus Omnitrophota bacterium]
MCGIIGYIGKRETDIVLTKGLSRLEYRGYDSAGVAVISNGEINVKKKQGKLAVLREELAKGHLKGTVGIGHTRWATHGVPNDINSHPHLGPKKNIAIVHNGIIENYQTLKNSLQKKGHIFLSETDSEIIAHIIENNYSGDLYEAVKKSIKVLEGSYALCIIHKDEPNRIIGVRKDSPLIAGIGEGEFFIASDIPAILDYTREVIYLENGDIVDVNEKGMTVYASNGENKKIKTQTIEWDISKAEKGGFEHFMLKEIYEQPEILKKLIKKRIKKNQVVFDELTVSKEEIKKIKKIIIIACGTAYHAGLTGKYMIEKIARIPVWVDQASEFRYRDPLVDNETLVVCISQSGETADTLAALREAKKRGASVISICNVLGSTIARESDGVIYTYAGPEIAVASTKAYTAQIMTLYLFTYYLAEIKKINSDEKEAWQKEIAKIPVLAAKFLEKYSKNTNKLQTYASIFHKFYLTRNNKSCFLYLARNINFPNALEGALKLKEISYISAEGYPAGEMKHGPIALIDENPWVVCIAPRSETKDKMHSNIQEIKARGGIVLAVITEGDSLKEDKSIDYIVEIPDIEELFSPILVVLPLQILAYHIAREFGYDIDQPRNLAKSVTVE